jgi:Ser/Thr protein kinase RdoA (MazF antagonist)
MNTKPFEQLTKRGQGRRLRSLVINALEQYDFDVSDIQLVGLFTNAIFRLRTKNGQSYIMRVCTPGWRTKTDLISEIMWLQALSNDTDIRVPEPKPTRDGDLFVESSAPGVPETRRCVVMSWVPGSQLETRLNEINLHKMGVLFAKLHDHGSRFTPSNGFTTNKMDSICARGEPDVLFSEASYDAFTANTNDILRQTDQRVKEAFAHLFSAPQGIQVIHNDLHHGNIKIYHGQLFPLDFEDTIWGYPVQDIAMALQDLMVDVAPDEYDPLQRAFREGYESLRSWPEEYEGQIDTFRAGRMLWVANYVGRYQRKFLREFIDWLAPMFNRYLETGLIRKA